MLNKEFLKHPWRSNPPPHLSIPPPPSASLRASRSHSHLVRGGAGQTNMHVRVWAAPLSLETSSFSMSEHISSPGVRWAPSGLGHLLPKNVVSLSKWILLSGGIPASFPRVPIMCCVRLKSPVHRAFYYSPWMYCFLVSSQETVYYLLNKP